MIANGHSLETVQILLGHAYLDHVAAYLDVSEQEQPMRSPGSTSGNEAGPSDDFRGHTTNARSQ
ncbi:hypothetical protein [Pandoraea sp.]|uniref:hypothetical protein n=1 Tax=Pandoraea sp. TaxID=1883445 RepID=UPI0025F26629|nr:hypothetical protein [Pandoraea sp.]